MATIITWLCPECGHRIDLGIVKSSHMDGQVCPKCESKRWDRVDRFNGEHYKDLTAYNATKNLK
jgi:DNA-directed RNA polymerase subunit RPC12/RpoP